MRGCNPQRSLPAIVDLKERVSRDHPLRRIKEVADTALGRLSSGFGRMYAQVGRALCDEVVWATDGGLLSDEHFGVDGTLIEAAASPGTSGPRMNRRRPLRTTIRAIRRWITGGVPQQQDTRQRHGPRGAPAAQGSGMDAGAWELQRGPQGPSDHRNADSTALVVADVIPNPFFRRLLTGGKTELAALDMEA